MNCVASVEKYNTARIKYIVVDNGSPREGTVEALDGSLSEMFTGRYARYEEGEEVKRPLPFMTLLVSKVNDGYACGNNKGLRIAYGDDEIDYVMILNNDTLFIQDIIPGLVEKYPQLDKAAIISPLLLKKDGKRIDYNCARTETTAWRITYRHLFIYIDPFGMQKRWKKKEDLFLNDPRLLKEDHVEVKVLSGACLFSNKKIFESIGSFDPHTFLYNEENILHKKTESKGYKCYVIPRYSCIHVGASSTKSSPGLFVMRASISSSQYYIDEYSGASAFQKKLFRFVSHITILEVRFKEFVFKTFNIKRRHRDQ